jgi:hypothetical protein
MLEKLNLRRGLGRLRCMLSEDENKKLNSHGCMWRLCWFSTYWNPIFLIKRKCNVRNQEDGVVFQNSKKSKKQQNRYVKIQIHCQML